MSDGEVDLVWQVMGGISHCMLIVDSEDRLRARPMIGVVEREANAIWFPSTEPLNELVERSSRKTCLTFVDDVQSIFLSVSGDAEMVSDSSKIDEINEALQNQSDGAFVAEPDTATLLRFTPVIAEYWRHPRTELMVALDALTSGRPQDFSNGNQTNGLVRFTAEKR